MNDQNLLQDLLTTCKAQCDLFMHGAMESSTGPVRDAFNNALFECLRIQSEIAKKMSEKGMYSADTVSQTKVNQTSQKWIRDSDRE